MAKKTWLKRIFGSGNCERRVTAMQNGGFSGVVKYGKVFKRMTIEFPRDTSPEMICNMLHYYADGLYKMIKHTEAKNGKSAG